MTVHEAKCDINNADQLSARRSEQRVEVSSKGDRDVYLVPSTVRTFARGLLALADEIDGGEEVDERPKVGDRLRITQDFPWSAPVKTNDVITVVEVDYDRTGDEDTVRFLQDGDDYKWHLPLTAVEPLADWERDLLESAEAADKPSSVARDRVAFIDEARRVAGELADPAEILAYAKFLAGE